jgi:hypothetical protein
LSWNFPRSHTGNAGEFEGRTNGCRNSLHELKTTIPDSGEAARDWPLSVREGGRDMNPARYRLDRLEIQRARLARIVGTRLIGQALADRRGNILVPRNRALFEMDEIAADFRLDFAQALGRVERLYDSELSSFPGTRRNWRLCRLKGGKEGGRSDLAPKTVDHDW